MAEHANDTDEIFSDALLTVPAIYGQMISKNSITFWCYKLRGYYNSMLFYTAERDARLLR